VAVKDLRQPFTLQFHPGQAPELIRQGLHIQSADYTPEQCLEQCILDRRGIWLLSFGFAAQLAEKKPVAREVTPADLVCRRHALAEDSGGAYDVTVGPLVNLWGFGPDPAALRVPEASALNAARARVGWRKIEVDASKRRARKVPGVQVDLSSLGKGRGVDRVAEYLDAQGVSDYLIDLSGKLRARGVNARGETWRVAVEPPEADATSARPRLRPEVIALENESVATAGDYRRFFVDDGRHFSHIIDPRTGWPVTHDTVSASAIAADCMQADALATVLIAMSPDDAIALANRRGLRALLIGRDGAGYVARHTGTWASQ
jgi:thiamine biosynthesis lipoprotein